MADGFTLTIDDDMAALIDRRAKESGLSREETVRHALAQSFFRYDDYTWIGDDPRTTPTSSEPAQASTAPWHEIEAWMKSWGKPGELPKPRLR